MELEEFLLARVKSKVNKEKDLKKWKEISKPNHKNKVITDLSIKNN